MKIWSAEIKEIEKLHESHKGQFRELEKELEHLLKAEDENVVMLYSRRCLEVIIEDLCQCELKRPRKTEPLKGIIDKLNKEEKVPSHIITSMDNLNSLSTYGTHPKDFDPEQVKPVLINLNIIIKWYLKYMDTRKEIKAKPAEEIRQEIKSSEDIKKSITISRKRVAGLAGGLIAAIVAVFAVLYFSGIIGGSKQTEEIEKSIAVLPFENLSSDEDKAWFNEGITDIILNQLSKISGIRVLGRTSTLKFREEKKTIKEIGKELDVNYIIEGTVQRQEDKMRISVQLIRVFNEGHIWADIYDREWKDIFDVQSEIAQQIADELKTVLSPEEKEQIENSQTDNAVAYNLYLQGRYFWYKRTKEGLEKSIEYFEKAIDADPDYALAYAGLADAYFIQAYWGWIPWNEGTARSKELVLRALDMDRNLAEAHAVLGALLNYKEWKWEEARKELKLAVELNPKFVTGHHYYSELLDIFRRNIEARKEINRAMELDPFIPVLHGLSSMYYYNDGKLNESLDECNVVKELDADYGTGTNYWREFDIFLKQKEDLLALEALQKAIAADSLIESNSGNVVEIYKKSGINGVWNWLIERELEKSKPIPLVLAERYARIDKKEEALNWLEKAFEDPPPGFPRININPDFDSLRSEPGFQAIIKKMGLSEYQIPK